MPANSNYRVFYPLHYIGFAALGSSGGAVRAAHGVQSIGLTTSFNLEQVFELGQLEIYENVENLPNIEVTAEKALDGDPLLYHLATPAATSATLVNRTRDRTDVYISYFRDTGDAASGTPLTQVQCSGMYLNSLSYNLGITGPSTESISLIGNDKVWKTSSFYFSGHFDNTDTPNTVISRRQHVLMGAAPTGSVFPTEINGMTTAGGSGYNLEQGGGSGYSVHAQNIGLSVNLNREDILELGRIKPYYRYATFPTAVDCSISVLAAGSTPGDLINANSDSQANLSNQPILIRLNDGTVFNLGTRNKLSNVSVSGGDTGGGNVTMTYAYQNFNTLKVTHPQDPAGLS